MTEDIENDDKKIVQSGTHGLVKSSSGLVRRGLDDLLLLSEKESVEENSVDYWLQRGCDLVEEAVQEEQALREANQEFKLAPQRAEALSCYEKAIEIDVYCTYAWVLRASSLETLGRWRESVESLERAIELIRAGTADYNPQPWRGYRPTGFACLAFCEAHQLAGWKGRLLMEQGEFEEAIRSCDLAFRLSSDANTSFNADCLENKGTSLHSLGRYEEAIQSFDNAITMLTEQELEPGRFLLERPMSLSGAWTAKGMSLDRLGRSKEAMECYDMADSVFPRDWEPWYKGQVRIKDAIDAYEAYLANATPDETTPSDMNLIEKAREHLQALKSRFEVNGLQDK